MSNFPQLSIKNKRVRESEYRKLKYKFFAGLGLSALLFMGSSPRFFPWVPLILQNYFVLWALTTPVQFWIGGRAHPLFLSILGGMMKGVNFT
ncbi:MAG: hypothetical protein WCC06_10160 [Candidatus Aminicenantales bacterium]